MSLFKRLFGDKPAPAQEPVSSFHDSASLPAPTSRGVPRREVVHVVLRDTMRRHGIPSDWIECRTLSLVQSSRSTGTYVTFIVRHGQDRLLAYVPAFQASFREALDRFDPRAGDWLRGIAWQFDSFGPGDIKPMPGPAAWEDAAPRVASSAAVRKPAPQPDEEDDLQSDLKALFAIRDAALKGAPVAPDGFKPTENSGL